MPKLMVRKAHGKVRVIIHTFPTKAPWLNPMEAVIGIIIRYGLKNKSHRDQENYTVSDPFQKNEKMRCYDLSCHPVDSRLE
jgi:hypothetical protein